jgi:succinyl-CoA---D-citramalate CoA-transferase
LTHPGEAGLPLEHLRVLELGSLIAGPFAGRILADFGAEVIKVEAPAKLDPLREWGQARHRGRTLWWPVQSRNKKLITLDLARGRDLFLRLVERADVVIENFRPGTLERWDLGYERLREHNPRVVLLRVSGYGQTGPQADRAGFAAVAEAESGLRSLNGYPGQPPPRTGLSLGDSVAGMFGVIGALVALLARDQVGGQVVDVSLLESCVALLESAIPEFDRTGLVREPSGTHLKGNAPSDLVETADGKWLVIAANQDALFRRLTEAMGRPDLADDDRFSTHRARGENQELIEGIVASWARTLTAQELEGLLADHGVACGAVATIPDVVANPQLRAREALVVHVDEEVGEMLGPGVTPKLSRTPGALRWSARWQPGVDNEDVYQRLIGLSAEDLSRLRAQGMI